MDLMSKIVAEHMGFARGIARKFRWALAPHIGFEDLVSEAYIGLVKAADRFDPERGVQFQSFARPWVAGAISEFVRRHGGSVRVPRRIYQLGGQVLRAGMEDAEPTAVAAAIQCSPSGALDALNAIRHNRSSSLDQPLSADEDAAFLGDVIGIQQDKSVVVVREFLHSLKPNERRIVMAAIAGGERSARPTMLESIQSKLAAYMELSESEVSQMSHELTKEKFLERKRQGITDLNIRNEFHIGEATLTRLKKKWGVTIKGGRSKTISVEDQPPVTDERLESNFALDEAKRRIAQLQQEVALLKAVLKFYL